MSGNLLVESIVVGLATLIIGLVLWMGGKCLFPQVDMRTVESHIVVLFLIGFILHLFSEWLGVNSWYCSNRE